MQIQQAHPCDPSGFEIQESADIAGDWVKGLRSPASCSVGWFGFADKPWRREAPRWIINQTAWEKKCMFYACLKYTSLGDLGWKWAQEITNDISPCIMLCLDHRWSYSSSAVKDVAELLSSSSDADSSLPTNNMVRNTRKSTSHREVKCGIIWGPDKTTCPKTEVT